MVWVIYNMQPIKVVNITENITEAQLEPIRRVNRDSAHVYQQRPAGVFQQNLSQIQMNTLKHEMDSTPAEEAFRDSRRGTRPVTYKVNNCTPRIPVFLPGTKKITGPSGNAVFNSTIHAS